MKTNPNVAGPRTRWSLSYVFAIGVSLLVLGPFFLARDMHIFPVFLFFYMAVLAVAWFGGLGPGLVAVFLTLVESWYFVVPPVNSFAITNVSNAGSVLTYVLAATATAAIVARLRNLKLRTELLLASEREAREATEEAERRNTSLLESIGDAFYSLDSEWRFTYVNRHAEQLLRKSRAELVGRNIWDEFPEARGSIFEQHYKEVVERQKAQGFETYYAPLDFWTEVRAYPKDDGGISVFFQDVTERHRLVAELEKNAQRFERTFDLAGVGIAHVGLDGRWLRVNQRLCEIVGYSRPEMLSKTFQDITVPEDLEKDVEQYQRLKAGEIDRYAMEKRYLHKNGTVVWVSLTVSLMRESEAVEYAIAVVEDISERKAAEEQLLRLSAIVESSEDAIFAKTLQGVITTWNSGAVRMYGYSAAEIVGRPVSVLIPSNRPDEMPSVLSRLAMGEQIGNYDTVRRRKDGTLVDVSLNISPIRDALGSIIGASTIARDITQIKRRTSELESLLSNAPVGLAFFDRQYRYLRINPALATINGISIDEHSGQTLRDIVPENADIVEPIVDEVFESGRTIEREITGQTPKEPGVNRTWIAGFYPVFAGGAEPFAVGAYVIEITDRKKTEQRVRESEERLQTIVENLAEGLVVVNAEGSALHWNRTALQMHGYASHMDELTFLSGLVDTYELSTLDGRVISFEEWPVRRLLRGEDVRDYELVVHNKKDHWERIFSYGGVLVPESAGHHQLGLLTIRDITEKKKIEQALKESEERLRFALESCHIGAWDIDLVDHTAYRSLEHDRIFGYTELLPQWTLGDFLRHALPEYRARVEAIVREATAAQSGWTYECPIRRADGEIRWIWFSGRHIASASGHGRVVGVVQDITERRRAEEALRESEQRFRALADNMSQLAWMADENGYIFWYNKRWFDYTGTSLEEMRECGWQKVHHPDHVERVVEKISRCFATGEIWEDTFPLRAKSGEYRWFLTRAIPIRDESGKVLRWFGTNTDVTEQRQTQESLKVREQQLMEANRLAETRLAQFRATIDNMTEGVYVCGGEGEPLLVNPALLRLLEFAPDTPPEAFHRIFSLVDLKEVGGEAVPSSRWPVARALGGEHVNNCELRVVRTDTGKEMILSHNAAPIHDEDGRVIMAVVTVEDVTAIKQAQKALLQSEKLASVGRMAATIAHEINNPLETVMNAVYLAATYPGVPDTARTSLELAERELERVAHITRQTLGFYRDPGTPTVVDLAKTIDGVVDVYAPRIKMREIDLKCETQSGSEIAAVEGEMRQVLSNLIANSIDAINGSGRLRLRSKTVNLPDGKQRVRVTVADTGVGIAREHLRVIFEPFFTTKAELGTGLGLWVTRELVQKNRGSIRVRSREGCGTVFALWFPAANVPGVKAA